MKSPNGTKELTQFLDQFWEKQILPTLTDFIKIPNESPSFDRDWAKHGHMKKAAKLVTDWIKAQQVRGLKLKTLQDGSRTPLILADIPGGDNRTVLIYGHIDKQPPMTGWNEGLGPWKPVRDKQGRLYGRGGADDGYSVFAAIAAARAMQEQGISHSRLLVLIECSEESGSVDLPHYLSRYKKEIGTPDLVIALDSGCGNYDQLWNTTSLRGLLNITLKVEVMREGVHSGIGGGIVPSPYRIMNMLIDRIEDQKTGQFRLPELKVTIPKARREQAREAARVLGQSVAAGFPFIRGAQMLSNRVEDMLLDNAWKPALVITGQEGIPDWGAGGNVLPGSIGLKLSMRLPPGVEPAKVGAAVRKALTAKPPFGAKITVTAGGAPGWNAPPTRPWLEKAINDASSEFYGKPACHIGLGGTIPFMKMIGDQYPKAQFLITGVLGPNSNAHGPNEFLHIPYAKKLTAALVRILERHHQAG